MKSDLIEITAKVISPEQVINRAKTGGSGCVATYVGLIRDNSHGKKVASVEYQDKTGKAAAGLRKIAAETKEKWTVENIAFTHRIGKLKVGDINLVIAVAAGHRGGKPLRPVSTSSTASKNPCPPIKLKHMSTAARWRAGFRIYFLAYSTEPLVDSEKITIYNVFIYCV